MVIAGPSKRKLNFIIRSGMNVRAASTNKKLVIIENVIAVAVGSVMVLLAVRELERQGCLLSWSVHGGA